MIVMRWQPASGRMRLMSEQGITGHEIVLDAETGCFDLHFKGAFLFRHPDPQACRELAERRQVAIDGMSGHEA